MPRPMAIEYIRGVKEARSKGTSPRGRRPVPHVRRPLSVKRNRLEREGNCAGCGQPVQMRIDEVLVFVDGTWDVVCQTCAAVTDPALAHLVAFGQTATAFARDVSRGPAWVSDEAEFSAQPGREIELTVHHYKGARKPWVARLTARDERYKFARGYIDTVPTKTDPAGQFGDYVARIRTAGVYQIGDAGDRTGFWLCWTEDRGLRLGKISEERAGAIVDLVSLGADIEEAKRQSRPRIEPPATRHDA